MPLDVATRPLLPECDRKRAEHQALRERLLDGGWGDDLEKALAKHIDPSRRTVWGIPEMSRNTFRSVSSQVGGVLYRTLPPVRGETGSDELIKAITKAGFWELQQYASTKLVGLRESVVRVDWSKRGGLLHRAIPNELVYVEALPEAPDVPVLIEEIQSRRDPKTGKEAWCWECIDTTDLENPTHRILSADRKEDWTAACLGGDKSGANFQYRDSRGEAYMPAVMYHAERTGRLWNAFYGLETVLGTLTMGVLLTFWVHGIKDGSFATVVVVSGRVVGLEISGPGGTNRTQILSTEPGAIIEVAPSDEGVQPQIIQLEPGFDPEKLMNAIGMFESGLCEFAGISGSDLVRTGADPRSGVSLSIQNSGLRTAMGRMEPGLRRGDLAVIETSAKILNGATGTNYPESGYAIEYPSLPLSDAEKKAQLEMALDKQAAGLASVIDNYMELHPGVGRDFAIADLKRIQAENEMFRTPDPASTAPTDPANPTDAPPAAPAPSTPIALTSTDIASIVTVNEARLSQGLPPMSGPEGLLTVAEFQARNAAVIAAAANATAGTPTTPPTNPPPP